MVDKYSNLTNAGAVVGLNTSVCLSVNKVYKGFCWTYDFVDKFIPIIDSRKKKVQQYNIHGEFLKEYNSVSEASKFTDCNKSGIAKVCRGERKSCGGYIWQYI